MTARHMRNAIIADTSCRPAPDSVLHGVDTIEAPVAMAFTEAEVAALARYLSTGERSWLGDLGEAQQDAIDAILAAADDIERSKA